MKHQALYFASICLFVSSVVCAQVTPEEAAKYFEDVFGAEVQRARQTPTSEDDLLLAQTMVGAVAQSIDNPAMALLLCEKAAALSERHVSGADIALQALNMLLEKSPDTVLKTHRRIVAVHYLRYSRTPSSKRADVGQAYIEALLAQAEAFEKAADHTEAVSAIRRAIPIANAIRWEGRAQLRPEIDRLLAAQKSNRKLDDLKAKIKANPKDAAAAGELVKIYLVELGQPAEAAKYALMLPDGEMQQNVLLAATPIEELTEDQLMRLGQWYKSLGQGAASKAAGLRMFELSKACLARYMAVHTVQDLMHTKARLLVLQLDTKIAALQRDLGPKAASGTGSTRTRFSSGVVRFIGKPITLEAERAGKIVGKGMKVYKNGQVSFLSIPKRSGDRSTHTRTPSKGRLLITVQVAKATQIRIQGRLNTPSRGSGNNSFFVAVVPGKQVDAPRFTHWEGPTQTEWTWMTIRQAFPLAAGLNTIIIAAREEGAMIDKIRIAPVIER